MLIKNTLALFLGLVFISPQIQAEQLSDEEIDKKLGEFDEKDRADLLKDLSPKSETLATMQEDRLKRQAGKADVLTIEQTPEHAALQQKRMKRQKGTADIAKSANLKCPLTLTVDDVKTLVKMDPAQLQETKLEKGNFAIYLTAPFDSTTRKTISNEAEKQGESWTVSKQDFIGGAHYNEWICSYQNLKISGVNTIKVHVQSKP